MEPYRAASWAIRRSVRRRRRSPPAGPSRPGPSPSGDPGRGVLLPTMAGGLGRSTRRSEEQGVRLPEHRLLRHAQVGPWLGVGPRRTARDGTRRFRGSAPRAALDADLSLRILGFMLGHLGTIRRQVEPLAKAASAGRGCASCGVPYHSMQPQRQVPEVARSVARRDPDLLVSPGSGRWRGDQCHGKRDRYELQAVDGGRRAGPDRSNRGRDRGQFGHRARDGPGPGQLTAVRKAAKELLHRTERIDLLINNAGVMWRTGAFTDDGSDPQLAVTHLGHFPPSSAQAGVLESPGYRHRAPCRSPSD